MECHNYKGKQYCLHYAIQIERSDANIMLRSVTEKNQLYNLEQIKRLIAHANLTYA